MVSDIIEAQLKKVEKADLSNFNPETNTYIIKRRMDIKVEVDNCYLVHLKDELFRNEALKINWNSGKVPEQKYLKVEVNKIMAKMIKVTGIGYDYDNKKDLGYFWSGWLFSPEIEVLEKI